MLKSSDEKLSKTLKNNASSIDRKLTTENEKNENSLYIETRTHTRDKEFINNINNNKFINNINKEFINLENKQEKKESVANANASSVVSFTKFDEKDFKQMAKTSKKEQLRFKAIEAYKTRNISNFSLESWILWVDYKLEKEKEPTMTTFNHNLNQLISFRDKAEQSLDNSISSGWRGLFAVKEKKAYGKKGKVLSKEQEKEVLDYILEMNGAKEEYYASLENKKLPNLKREDRFNGAF